MLTAHRKSSHSLKGFQSKKKKTLNSEILYPEILYPI